MDVAERLRGFENPLPRTESPGLAQLMQMRRNVFCRPIRSSDKCINSRPRAFVLGLGCAHEQSRKGRLKVRLFSAVPYGTVHVSEIYPGLAPWAKLSRPGRPGLSNGLFGFGGTRDGICAAAGDEVPDDGVTNSWPLAFTTATVVTGLESHCCIAQRR